MPNAEALLYIKDGVVLQERDGFGATLLAKIDLALKTPLKPIPQWDIELRITWIKKMLARAAVGDAEGNYRRHWLLFDLLETWFAFSNLRYHGVKESLKNLEQIDVATFSLFGKALKPQADLDTIARLGQAVISKGQMQLERTKTRGVKFT